MGLSPVCSTYSASFPQKTAFLNPRIKCFVYLVIFLFFYVTIIFNIHIVILEVKVIYTLFFTK